MATFFYMFLWMGVAGIGVIFTIIMQRLLSQRQNSDEKSARIAFLIRQGAMTFLRQEYTILAIVILVAFLIIAHVFSRTAGLAYVAGALSSMFAGIIGMRAATRANEATTVAAKNEGERAAFITALMGGSVMGFVVASLGLFGLGIIFYLFYGTAYDMIKIFTCYGVGASSIALFARVGGGIYTKAADVGADLVGKVEMGIPEDDPRNPAVIADNVGDCVGDTAGMGADIFESYIVSVVSALALAVSQYANNLVYITLPIVLCAIGLVASLISLLFFLKFATKIETFLQKTTYLAIVLFILGAFAYLYAFNIDLNLFGSIALGAFAGILIGLSTDYYTSGKPIRKLAETSKTGAGTNLIYGLSLGFESVVFPVCAIAIIVFISHSFFGGLFGISLAAVSMLATVAITMTVDAYGPIADNAGGISEMSGYGPNVRKITDKLDSLGNMTAALGKGFAIGSAVLAALAVFATYCQAAHIPHLDLFNAVVIAGFFIGGTLPFLISALTMRSVSRAAWKMVLEVRRQFTDIKGLLEGTAEADYARCIGISTRAALIEMLLPGFITIAAPIIIKIAFGAQGSMALGGFLAGATLTGVVLALTMANAGGAWDNAKKYIEAGNLGGKGSDAHRAAVVGDTVGDPFKDTSGPSLNILIKLMSMLSLLLAMM
ncbi:MAG: sodium-translocating pyrophosphatase [Candidatus Babeliales bacterium]|jgi:K(+)-stimulated pyrophosphate-energized sodium pump